MLVLGCRYAALSVLWFNMLLNQGLILQNRDNCRLRSE
jgi:hypothetical protein